MILYKITNKINRKVYIGQTVGTLPSRWRRHCSKSSKCPALKKAIQKYGSENFQIEILEECSSLEELNRREEDLIKSFNSLAPNGYNIALGGTNRKKTKMEREKLSRAAKGRKLSSEAKERLLQSRKGIPLSDAHKQKIGLANSGKVPSKETRTKMSEAKKGKTPWNKGKRPSRNDIERKVLSQGCQSFQVQDKKTNEIVWQGLLQTDCCKFLGLQPQLVNKCLKGHRKSHGGYTFRYIGEGNE